MKIKDIKASKVHLRELGNIKVLADSLKRHGLLQPIVVNQDNELIAGRRRLEAAKLLGWKEIDVNIIETIDDYDHLAKSLVENVQRKQLTWQEEVRFVQELDQLMRAKYGSAGQGERTDLAEDKPWSSKDTARMLERGDGRIREEIILAENLDKYPELEKAPSKSAAFRQLRKIQQKGRLAQAAKPEGLYDVIVVNPPWKYPQSDGMTIEEIASLDLPMSEDCIVFLWTTISYLPLAFDVLRKWNVEYKNIITWKKNIGGMGHWGRVVTEHSLLGIKGRPIADFEKMSNFVEAEKSEHGGKPDKFYEIVENMCEGRRLDVFGTENREGWEIMIEKC